MSLLKIRQIASHADSRPRSAARGGAQVGHPVEPRYRAGPRSKSSLARASELVHPMHCEEPNAYPGDELVGGRATRSRSRGVRSGDPRVATPHDRESRRTLRRLRAPRWRLRHRLRAPRSVAAGRGLAGGVGGPGESRVRGARFRVALRAPQCRARDRRLGCPHRSARTRERRAASPHAGRPLVPGARADCRRYSWPVCSSRCPTPASTMSCGSSPATPSCSAPFSASPACACVAPSRARRRFRHHWAGERLRLLRIDGQTSPERRDFDARGSSCPRRATPPATLRTSRSRGRDWWRTRPRRRSFPTSPDGHGGTPPRRPA